MLWKNLSSIKFSAIFYILIVPSSILCLMCPRPDDFHCDEATCVKASDVCNGRNDCSNRKDEENCELRDLVSASLCLPPKWYQCQNVTTCISSSFKCDGHNDCLYNDDEENCLNYVPHHEKINCTLNEFTCIKDQLCIPLDYVCDGTSHCMDNSDETFGCTDLEKECLKHKGFICASKKHCVIDKNWLCDGYNDCGDNSDEINCPFNCKPEYGKYLCNDQQSCVPFEKVCNKENDCPDGSDEGVVCNKTDTGCAQFRCPVKSQCYVLSSGPLCVCQKGYTYNNESKTCDDIDECLQYGICSQGCVNTIGSYTCTCVEKYRLKSDNRSCEVISSTEALMLYAGATAVYGMLLKSRHNYILTSNVHQVIGVTYDGQYAYWTDVAYRTESIVRAREDGSKREVILTSGITAPEDIVIDWLTGNIYFTDGVYVHIAVCSNDGKFCTSLVNKDIHRPRGICLYPQKGLMFWSDWGDVPLIAVASMDGLYPRTLVQNKIYWPNGLVIDWPNERLYWVDAKFATVESIDMNGNDRRIILDRDVHHPYGIAIFEDRLYWSDWDTMSIESCDKFTGKNRELIVKDRKIYDVHIFHSAAQPIDKHPCYQNSCSHLCLLSANATYTCACPKGMILGVDQIKCRPGTKKQVLLIGMGNYILTWEHQQFGKHLVERSESLPIYIDEIEYNSLNGQVFVADNTKHMIALVTLDTYTVTNLINQKLETITGLSFDYLANNLYWTDHDQGTIEIYSLYKKERAIVHRFVGNERPIGLIVLPEIGQLFVALHAFARTRMIIMNMDGSGPMKDIELTSSSTTAFKFDVDKQLRRVYFTDTAGYIGFITYDGKQMQIVQQGIKSPISIASLGNEIFWTISNSLKLYFIRVGLQEEFKQVAVDPPPHTDERTRMHIKSTTQLIAIDHSCKTSYSYCSHVCVSLGFDKQSCICPPGMIFNDNSNRTCIESIDCEFKCDSGECLTSSRRCNGHSDCKDGSDEMYCTGMPGSTTTCRADEFKCNDNSRCIDMESRCDKIEDCNDKSDEMGCEFYNRTTKCHAYQHACKSGECIDLTAICDGFKDCSGGEDEANCPKNPGKSKNCGIDFFTCTSGQCVLKEWKCDGHQDCVDGSDEHFCAPKPCPKNFGTCSNGQCIDKRLLCNGVNDCSDSSDEKNCTKSDDDIAEIACDSEITLMRPKPTKFRCTSNKIMCLDIKVRCNGIAECPRGEDEVDCSAICSIFEFECKNKRCIHKEWLCDKFNDCGDGSDEENCSKGTVNKDWKKFGIYTDKQICGSDLFDCKAITHSVCIEKSLVCDGVQDCPNNTDESSNCNKSCDNHKCEQKCFKTPDGPECGCNIGYKLSTDKLTCTDNDECKETVSPCAQICDNTLGSFRCSCYSGFFLTNDKISCKPKGEPANIIFTYYNVIWTLFPITDILLETNGTSISGLDINYHRKLIYYSFEESGTIVEYNQLTKENTFLENIGRPRSIAIDWQTNNVYLIDVDNPPSIKVCNFTKPVCLKLLQASNSDKITDLIIDSVNKYMFHSIYVYHIKDKSYASIYRHTLDALNNKILAQTDQRISAMTSDINKGLLYYAEMSTSTIWSIRYDGSDMRVRFKNEPTITMPNSISFYNDRLMIFNLGQSPIVECLLFDDLRCTILNSNIKNHDHLMIVQESRQPRRENVCENVNCTSICVTTENGPKCICTGGIYIEPGELCINDHPSHKQNVSIRKEFDPTVQSVGYIKMNESSTVGRDLGITFAVLCILVIIGVGVYWHRKQKVPFNAFNVFYRNNQFANRMHIPRIAQSSIIHHNQAYSEVIIDEDDSNDLREATSSTMNRRFSIDNHDSDTESIRAHEFENLGTKLVL